MKKLTNQFFFLFTLLLLLFCLTFIKFPIHIISLNNFDTGLNNFINLKSFEKQTLKILPTPKIELTNSSFDLNLKNIIKGNLTIPNITISYPFFNKNNIIIEIEKVFLEDVKSGLLNDTDQLEGIISKLKLNILNTKNLIEAKSTQFNYNDSVLAMNAVFIDDALSEIFFSLRHQEFNKLILLLDKEYQRYFKEFNFSNLEFAGKYETTEMKLLFERVILNLNDRSSFLFKGNINFNDYKKSNLSINGINILKKDFVQLLKLLNLQEGPISDDLKNESNFSSVYKDGKISIKFYNRITGIQEFGIFKRINP